MLVPENILDTTGSPVNQRKAIESQVGERVCHNETQYVTLLYSGHG